MFNSPLQSLQLWRVQKFYRDLLQIYTEHRCNGLVDLGDTTDDRQHIGLQTLDAVIAGIAAFPVAKYNFKIIGNHEQYYKTNEISTHRLYSPYFNVTSHHGRVRLDDGTCLLLCSFTEDTQTTVAWLETQKNERKTILFGHFQFCGCSLNSGTAKDGIPKESFEFADAILLGHIHKPQSKGNIHYVGSPFQQNFGESHEKKRVAIVNTYDLSIEWIPLPGFPEYHTVGVPEFKRQCKKESEDRFKVIVKSQKEAEEFYTHPLSAHVVDVAYEFTPEESAKDSVEKLNSEKNSFSVESIMRTYAEKNKFDGVNLSANEMLGLGKSIMES